MKKMYNQPEILISLLAPTTIICASITGGTGGTAGVNNGQGTEGTGSSIGD